jgi:hydroxyethylthiazole kinase
MSTALKSADLWSDVASLRAHAPLVHSITNMVVMNINANVLLAAGASPVMAHAHEEVADMVGIASALVLNIGTLDAYWVESMKLALAAASARGLPVVLDPVGAGATPYRTRIVEELITLSPPSVIRGNASEIMSVAGHGGRTRGVDSTASADRALESARALSERVGSVVCVSGAVVHVVDARTGRAAHLRNGHPWMTRVTGMGCSASAIVGALCAVAADPFRATVSAMALFGVAGELAVEELHARAHGVGGLQNALVDTLQLLDQTTFERRLKLEQTG